MIKFFQVIKVLLSKINSYRDFKNLKKEELKPLAKEIREAIIYRTSKIGGHLGSNLGIVELTIAMEYIFDLDQDKVVFDVSHQSYTHKILTGRKSGFTDEKCFNNTSGFTNHLESKYDEFTLGHSSTSISLALGLARARDINNDNYKVIAVIGDGALSGGIAYEGLNSAGDYPNNLIIILNDNKQSIAKNHGGIYKNLEELRRTSGKSSNNIFKALNLEYRYLDEGNNLEKLLEFFEASKDINKPIILHINTEKGLGLDYAIKNKEAWHATTAFDIYSGARKINQNFLGEFLLDYLKKDKKNLIINAATPYTLGLSLDKRQEFEDNGQFIDLGIAEEDMVLEALALKKNHNNIIFGTFATFLQRGYDQILHELSLNNIPLTGLVISPGVYGHKSNTHTSLADISFLSNLANVKYLAPYTKQEFKDMFYYALNQKENPILIRVPTTFSDCDFNTSNFLKNKVYKSGNKVAIMALSKTLDIALKVEEIIEEKISKNISIINPINLTDLDFETLDFIKNNHDYLYILEDVYKDGGYGQKVKEYLADSKLVVKCFGLDKLNYTNIEADKIIDELGYSTPKLVEKILKLL